MTREMEEKLLGCRDLSEFLAMFWGLGMREKLSAFPNKITIKEWIQ